MALHHEPPASDPSPAKPTDLPPPTTGKPGSRETAMRQEPSRWRRFFRLIGPGLIAGASDDDPATLGTCANAGALVGFTPLWLMLFAVPLMVTVQYLCAKVGQVTGNGLTAVLNKHAPRWLVIAILISLVIANTINAGADLGAMAAAVEMLTGLPRGYAVPVFALVIVGLQSWCTYCTIERAFTWLALSLAAYVVAGVLARPDWESVAWSTFVPHVEWSGRFLGVTVALLGTTFAPYLFFWQSDQEVEEKMSMGRRSLFRRRGTTDNELNLTGWDVGIGMTVSNVVTYSIILASAAALYQPSHPHGVRVPEDAARALEPVAGPIAKWLLAAGLIGGGFLAVPVLTTSAAYALAQTFGWKYSLDLTPGRAKRFYLVIALMTLAGCGLNYVGINPMDALVLTSTIYGFLAPPLLVLLLWITNRRAIMGARTNGWLLNTLGGIAALATIAGAIGLVISWFV